MIAKIAFIRSSGTLEHTVVRMYKLRERSKNTPLTLLTELSVHTKIFITAQCGMIGV